MSTEKYIVMGSNLNLRKKPDRKSKAIRCLDDGEIVEKIGEQGEWLNIKAGADDGYALKRFLERITADSNEDEGSYALVSKTVLKAAKNALNEALTAIDAMLNDER